MTQNNIFFLFEILSAKINSMEGCIEIAGPDGTTYFIKDSEIVARRVFSNEDMFNIERWYNQNGTFHRDGDLPAKTCYLKNGKKDYEFWYKDGKKHREGDLPAAIYYYESGQKTSECWYKDGQYHRDGDLPAEIYYHKNDQKYCEFWHKDGKKHRAGDLPAVIWYRESGQKSCERWYKDGELHRSNLPAAIHYHENGQKSDEHWYKDGELHRDGDLPAEIYYHENDQKPDEHWYKDDVRHRLRGPAKIETDAAILLYYHNGRLVQKEIGEWVSILPEIVATIKILPYPIFTEIKAQLYWSDIYEAE